MKEITVNETKKRVVKILPCVKCGNDDIEIKDCGYTTFNVAWVKCLKCGHEVRVNNCDWTISQEAIDKTWNKENDPKILRHKYEQQLIEIQKKIDALPK